MILYDRMDDTPLGMVIGAWMAQHRPASAALATRVAATLTESPTPTNHADYLKALQAVRLVTGSFGSDQLRAVIGQLVMKVNTPINPYEPDVLTEEYRSALVALLVARPEAQTEVELALAATLTPGQISPLTELAAAAIAGRPPDWGKSFMSLTRSCLRGSDSEARIAEIASSGIPHAALKEPSEGVGVLYQLLPHMLRRTAEYFVGPSVAVAVELVAREGHWSPTATAVDLADAIAILALIATVNIFAAQISANRLPGPLARVAAQPIWMTLSYNFAIILVIFDLFPLHGKDWTAAASWVVVILTSSALVGLVLALFSISKRTDPANAAKAYVSATLHLHRGSGRWVGSVQARTAELEAYVKSSIWLDEALGPQNVGKHRPIRAPRRGMMLPTPASLDRLQNRLAIPDRRLHLRFHAPFGIPFDMGRAIASLRTDSTNLVTSREADMVMRALRLESVGRVDRTAAAGTALTSLAIDLAIAGDVGSAHLVAEQAVLLVSEHVAMARRSRHHRLAQTTDARGYENVLRPELQRVANSHEEDKQLPRVSPVLGIALSLAVNIRLHSEKEVSDLPEFILRGLLEATTLSDGGCLTVSALLPTSWEEVRATPQSFAVLIESVAIRALELDDRLSLIAIMRAVGALLANPRKGEPILDAVSVVVANACWIRPSEALRLTNWFIELLARDGLGSQDALRLMRVGGAALAAGRIQVALVVARRLAPVLIADPLVSMTNISTRSREEALSNYGGRYLGDSPADTVSNFAQFAVDRHPAD